MTSGSKFLLKSLFVCAHTNVKNQRYITRDQSNAYEKSKTAIQSPLVRYKHSCLITLFFDNFFVSIIMCYGCCHFNYDHCHCHSHCHYCHHEPQQDQLGCQNNYFFSLFSAFMV